MHFTTTGYGVMLLNHLVIMTIYISIKHINKVVKILKSLKVGFIKNVRS